MDDRKEITWELVKRVIGDITPVGVSELDAERFTNLEDAKCVLLNLTEYIKTVARDCKDRREYSIQRAGKFADSTLIELKRNHLM